MPIRPQFETEAEWIEHWRMWFAGQALAGQLSDGAGVWVAKDCARQAYAYADAMIEARKVKP